MPLPLWPSAEVIDKESGYIKKIVIMHEARLFYEARKLYERELRLRAAQYDFVKKYNPEHK